MHSQASVWSSFIENKQTRLNTCDFMNTLMLHPKCMEITLQGLHKTLNEHCKPADCDANENRYIREKEWFEILQVSFLQPISSSRLYNLFQWEMGRVLLVAAADRFCGVKCNISFLLRNYSSFWPTPVLLLLLLHLLHENCKLAGFKLISRRLKNNNVYVRLCVCVW